MTIGEIWRRICRWMNTRQCIQKGHSWYPESGPLPRDCPACLQETRGEPIGNLVCARPPNGWHCTREPGHEGPCAARQDEEKPSTLWEEPKQYTDLVPAFYLYKEQSVAAAAWMKKHDKEKHTPKGKSFRYSGAIGGAYTWCFTPTSVGIGVSVRCSCGEELNISDYDNW